MPYIKLLSGLAGFINRETTIEQTRSERELLQGEIQQGDRDTICPVCRKRMHIHGGYETNLRHLSFGSKLSCVSFDKARYYCPYCQHTHMQDIAFKAEGHHNITCELEQYTRDLLA